MHRGLLDDTVKKINSDETKPLNILIKERVNTSSTPLNSLISSLQSTVNNLRIGTVPIVKSVQRGTLDYEVKDRETTTVTISNINPSKSILITLPECFDSGYDYILHASSSIIDGTTLIFGFNYSTGTKSPYTRHFNYGWQVIEFY